MNTRPPLVACIGGATVDRIFRVREALVPGSSNPVTAAPAAHGGVARNVAETLARLAIPAALAAAIGDDDAGRRLAERLRSLGVATALSVDREHATAEYIAVLQPSGELAFGLADMAIFDALSPSFIDEAEPFLSQAAWVFADCNPPREVLARLVQSRLKAPFRLAVDPVSTAKARRLPDDLSGIDLLFANWDEARVIAGEGASRPPREQVVRAITARGANRLVLTLGSDGALVAEGGTIMAELPSPEAEVVDVTGAGDALIAGTLSDLARGAPLVEAAATGLLCASLTLESRGSVRQDLGPDLLRAARARMQKATSCSEDR